MLKSSCSLFLFFLAFSETNDKKKKEIIKKYKNTSGLVQKTEWCNHSGGPKHAMKQGDRRNKLS